MKMIKRILTCTISVAFLSVALCTEAFASDDEYIFAQSSAESETLSDEISDGNSPSGEFSGAESPADDALTILNTVDGESLGEESSDPLEEIEGEDDEPIVLIDDDVCKVTITEFNLDDDYFGLVVPINIENKTDMNLYFTVEAVSLNDYMVNPWWSASVSSGAVASSELHFINEDLQRNFIDSIAAMEFTMKVRDDDNWGADELESHRFIVYPHGKNAELLPLQEFDESCINLVDNDDIRMVITGFETDDFSFNVQLYIENKTEDILAFSMGDQTSVNEQNIFPFFYQDVPSGKRINTLVRFYLADLEANNIDTINELQLDINVRLTGSWTDEAIFEEAITVELDS